MGQGPSGRYAGRNGGGQFGNGLRGHWPTPHAAEIGPEDCDLCCAIITVIDPTATHRVWIQCNACDRVEMEHFLLVVRVVVELGVGVSCDRETALGCSGWTPHGKKKITLEVFCAPRGVRQPEFQQTSERTKNQVPTRLGRHVVADSLDAILCCMEERIARSYVGNKQQSLVGKFTTKLGGQRVSEHTLANVDALGFGETAERSRIDENKCV